jgi:hypothetical protein
MGGWDGVEWGGGDERSRAVCTRVRFDVVSIIWSVVMAACSASPSLPPSLPNLTHSHTTYTLTHLRGELAQAARSLLEGALVQLDGERLDAHVVDVVRLVGKGGWVSIGGVQGLIDRQHPATHPHPQPTSPSLSSHHPPSRPRTHATDLVKDHDALRLELLGHQPRHLRVKHVLVVVDEDVGVVDHVARQEVRAPPFLLPERLEVV